MSRTGAEVYCGHYGIVQNGLLLVGKFYGVVYFGCTVCHGDSFRALRERYYRLDKKNLTSPKKEEVQAANIAAVLRTSWKTYQKLMTFLGK